MSNPYIELTPEEFRGRLTEVLIVYLPLGALEWQGFPEDQPRQLDGGAYWVDDEQFRQI